MEILWNLIRDGRQDLLFPGCDRNTTVAIECDWFSAVLVSLLSLGWFSFFVCYASRHSVRSIVESPGKEIQVTAHPEHFCRAAKIEADVLNS